MWTLSARDRVNAQVPSAVPLGMQAVSVTNAATGTSALAQVNVTATAAGLDAPPLFLVGGKQYVAALFTDNATYVLPPGAIGGVTSRQAKPGETIVMYGVGFGPTVPSIAAGQIAGMTNSLAGNLTITFAQVPATILYAGLAPGAVGLYQFNVVVPNIANSDTVPLSFTLNGTAASQTLYTAIHN